MSTLQEQAQLAQAALTTSRRAYMGTLLADVFQLKHEPGVQKMLDLAREKRAEALLNLSSGSKETFEAHQATWRVWDYVVTLIEVGPKTIELPKEQK